MSVRKQQQQTGQGHALTLVSSPAVGCQTNTVDLTDPNYSSKAPAKNVTVAARSVFLAQLASQYETKSAACARRMDTRALATYRYGETSPKPALRHLVWA